MEQNCNWTMLSQRGNENSKIQNNDRFSRIYLQWRKRWRVLVVIQTRYPLLSAPLMIIKAKQIQNLNS